MKIIHDPDTLKDTFKNAIQRNDCIKIAVFLFEPKILSDICGMEKDDFYEMLKSKLGCLYSDEKTIEAIKELIEELPVHCIKSPSKLFHPKVFFFSNSKSNDWEAIISSANITYGLAHDIQSSAHISQEDDGKRKMLRTKIEKYFNYLMMIEKKPIKKEIIAEFNDVVNLFLESIEPYLDNTFTSGRLWHIMKRALQGESYKDIGKDLGITGARAGQITRKDCIKQIKSIAKKLREEDYEKFIILQKAYKALVSSYAYIAAEERYPSCIFFKPRLNLLGELKKAMAN